MHNQSFFVSVLRTYSSYSTWLRSGNHKRECFYENAYRAEIVCELCDMLGSSPVPDKALFEGFSGYLLVDRFSGASGKNEK